MTKLPRSSRSTLVWPAVTRALDDPGRYLARLYPEIGTCELAVGMLGHPEWAARTLEAMGWGAAVNPPRECRG